MVAGRDRPAYWEGAPAASEAGSRPRSVRCFHRVRNRENQRQQEGKGRQAEAVLPTSHPKELTTALEVLAVELPVLARPRPGP